MTVEVKTHVWKGHTVQSDSDTTMKVCEILGRHVLTGKQAGCYRADWNYVEVNEKGN